MPRTISATLSLLTEGDAEADYSSGPFEVKSSAQWETQGVDVGALSASDASPLNPSIDAKEDRRRLFAVYSSGTLLRRHYSGIPFSGDAGTGTNIQMDIRDYPWLGSAASGTTIKCAPLWILTDPWIGETIYTTTPAVGEYALVEGEALDTWRRWDQPVGA